MAFAREAIQRRRETGDLVAIGRLCEAEGVRLVVIGLPLNMDGTEGDQAASARAFGQRLAAECGIEVAFEDERLSSWEAADRLAGGGRRRGRGSGELDSAAARVILQQYLDARRRAGDLEETE
jgi:putative Holliday junction resolvase